MMAKMLFVCVLKEDNTADFVKLHVDSTETIEEIKNKIPERISEITHQGRLLKPRQKLSDCQIQENAIVLMSQGKHQRFEDALLFYLVVTLISMLVEELHNLYHWKAAVPFPALSLDKRSQTSVDELQSRVQRDEQFRSQLPANLVKQIMYSNCPGVHQMSFQDMFELCYVELKKRSNSAQVVGVFMFLLCSILLKLSAVGHFIPLKYACTCIRQQIAQLVLLVLMPISIIFMACISLFIVSKVYDKSSMYLIFLINNPNVLMLVCFTAVVIYAELPLFIALFSMICKTSLHFITSSSSVVRRMFVSHVLPVLSVFCKNVSSILSIFYPKVLNFSVSVLSIIRTTISVLIRTLVSFPDHLLSKLGVSSSCSDASRPDGFHIDEMCGLSF